MDIRSQLKNEIDNLLSQSSGRQDCRLHVQWPAGNLNVELQDLQPLGCALWQLDVLTQQTAGTSADKLHQAGQQLVDRVRYLLEPLQVHELDRQQAAVQLRSSPPQRQSRTVWYYEVTAQHDGSWRLVRYEKTPGQSRQQVAAMLTLEVLQRVCQDVVDVASQA